MGHIYGSYIMADKYGVCVAYIRRGMAYIRRIHIYGIIHRILLRRVNSVYVYTMYTPCLRRVYIYIYTRHACPRSNTNGELRGCVRRWLAGWVREGTGGGWRVCGSHRGSTNRRMHLIVEY